MLWYRRSNLLWATFQNFVSSSSSKHLATNPPPLSAQIIHGVSRRVSFFGWSSKLGFLSALKLTRNTLPSKLGFLSLAGSCFTLISRLETIPYSKRTHLVLLPRWLTHWFGELALQINAEENAVIELPPTHPTSAKLTLIAENVINALQRDLTHNDKVWGWKAPWQTATQYMKHINWEYVVIDDPDTNAMCVPGGRIQVFSGVFEHFKSDAEIAAIISHEVAHVVARHGAESISKGMGLAIFRRLLYLYNLAAPVVLKIHEGESIYKYVESFLSRKRELEADYIGLLLMASAGYDPRAAMTVYGKLDGPTDWTEERFCTHPSGKKRVQLVAQALEEAMALYKESMSSLTSTDRTQQG